MQSLNKKTQADSDGATSFSLLSKKLADYLTQDEQDFVYEAFTYSCRAHEGQMRKSGEPYVTHPVAVATILCQWRLDHKTLAAAILHDVIEDTSMTFEEIRQIFGQDVADLVDGVSKITRVVAQKEKRAENFSKMLLAMARDIRVILIKLADRLHNMRTLSAMPPQKIKNIARETLEIYAPIAHRLGLNDASEELQALSFQFIYPWRSAVLRKAVHDSSSHQNEVIEESMLLISQRLNKARIKHKITGREKNSYSIYNKMKKQHLSFSQLRDIFGIRIVVPTIRDCYLCLGEIHATLRPLPGQFKDYIALPKNNGYQSLHTTIVGRHGLPVEIQIRTQDMENIAESGLAAHWLYKNKTAELTELQKKTHSWLQSLLEIQRSANSAQEFLEYVKIDLFPDEVYIFTPRGDIKTLPKGATAIDFAYCIHTNVGHRAIGAKINGLNQSLKTELQSGDSVEIGLGDIPNPKASWLNHVRSGRARLAIRNFLKTRHHEESAVLGERLLARSLSAIGVSIQKDLTPRNWETYLHEHGYASQKDVFMDLGLGKSAAPVVARALIAQENRDRQQQSDFFVLPQGGSANIRVACCCSPIPGDTVIGIIEKGKGLSIHMHDCPIAHKQNSNHRGQTIDVEWGNTKNKMFSAVIQLKILNNRGVLGKISSKIAEAGSDINNVLMEQESDDRAVFLFLISVTDRKHLAHIFRKIRLFPEVLKVTRPRRIGSKESRLFSSITKTTP